MGIARIPRLILGLCQGNMGAVVANGHSHESNPYVAVLTPAAKGLIPMAVNVNLVVTILPPSIVQRAPSVYYYGTPYNEILP